MEPIALVIGTTPPPARYAATKHKLLSRQFSKRADALNQLKRTSK